jgi:hypothetical protein
MQCYDFTYFLLFTVVLTCGVGPCECLIHRVLKNHMWLPRDESAVLCRFIPSDNQTQRTEGNRETEGFFIDSQTLVVRLAVLRQEKCQHEVESWNYMYWTLSIVHGLQSCVVGAPTTYSGGPAFDCFC